MRKVILNVAITLDGLIEGPSGEYDWCFTDEDYGMNEFLEETDTIFFGRKSYELFIASFSHLWNDKKHVVFSNTMQSVPTGTVLIGGEIEEAVMKLKNEKGKNIWLFGGASLATSLVKAGLVDELLLAIHPIILGAGKALFSGLDGRVELTLQDSKTYKSGLVQNRYAVIY